jgi:hypothetical protein
VGCRDGGKDGKTGDVPDPIDVAFIREDGRELGDKKVNMQRIISRGEKQRWRPNIRDDGEKAYGKGG